MILCIPLEARVRTIIRASFIVAKRTSETRYSLSGDSFQMSEITSDQVLILPDTVDVSEGQAITDELRMQALIGDEVLYDVVGGMNKLKTKRQNGETQQEYEDRIYTEALNRVNDAIVYIEESGAYNFQSYCGTPDVEWYDNVRDWVVEDVMAWMTE